MNKQKKNDLNRSNAKMMKQNKKDGLPQSRQDEATRQ